MSEFNFPFHIFPPPVELVLPESGAHVRGTIEIRARMRDGITAPAKMLYIIDGTTIETKFPFKFTFDTSYSSNRVIKIEAEAFDNEGNSLGKEYRNIVADNGGFNMDRILLLMGAEMDRDVGNLEGVWTPEQLAIVFDYANHLGPHLIKYGYVPSFLSEFDQYTPLIDPSQMDKGDEEFEPKLLTDVFGSDTNPKTGKKYIEMEYEWTPGRHRGFFYHKDDCGNGVPDFIETMAISIGRDIAQHGVIPSEKMCLAFFNDMAKMIDKRVYSWDWFSQFGSIPPLEEKIRKHVLTDNITGILLFNLYAVTSDFEEIKYAWEKVQEILDKIEKEMGKKVDLAMVTRNTPHQLGDKREYAEVVFESIRYCIQKESVPEGAKVGLILGEHGSSKSHREYGATEKNYSSIRKNFYDFFNAKKLKEIRKGPTTFSINAFEWDKEPDDGMVMVEEKAREYVSSGYDFIIVSFLDHTFESRDTIENRENVLKLLDQDKCKEGYIIGDNYRNRCQYGKAKIIINNTILNQKTENPANYQRFVNLVNKMISKRLSQLETGE